MTEKTKNPDFKYYLNVLLKALRHLLLHNGLLKGLAILISIVLWAGLISQDESVTRDKSFQNVAVSVTGTEALKSNSMIVVSDLDEVLNNVSVVAAVPQKQYDAADASAYNVRLDLSRIKGTGRQEVKLLSSNSNIFGKVTSISPSSVTVDVEEYIIRQRIPVSVPQVEGIPEGWYMSTPTVDPALIAVSGPKSIVQNISRARAFIDTADIEWKEGQILTSSAIVLYNRSQEVVDNSLVSMTSSSLKIDSVVIELNILPSEGQRRPGIRHKKYPDQSGNRDTGSPAGSFAAGDRPVAGTQHNQCRKPEGNHPVPAKSTEAFRRRHSFQRHDHGDGRDRRGRDVRSVRWAVLRIHYSS